MCEFRPSILAGASKRPGQSPTTHSLHDRNVACQDHTTLASYYIKSVLALVLSLLTLSQSRTQGQKTHGYMGFPPGIKDYIQNLLENHPSVDRVHLESIRKWASPLACTCLDRPSLAASNLDTLVPGLRPAKITQNQHHATLRASSY